MSVWFVKPEEVRLDLVYTDASGEAHPFWIGIKKALTIGEQRRWETAGWRGGPAGPADVTIDWKIQSFARTEAYLLHWSFTDDDHQAVPVTRETIETLDQDVYRAVENAITEHILAVMQEKKRTRGDSGPQAISA